MDRAADSFDRLQIERWESEGGAIPAEAEAAQPIASHDGGAGHGELDVPRLTVNTDSVNVPDDRK